MKAISANPVDYKVRKRAAPPEGETKILGYDAAGIVDAVGPDVTLFKPGDEVFYAGSILRQGTNSEFHLVDERIVGKQAEDRCRSRRPQPFPSPRSPPGNCCSIGSARCPARASIRARC